MLETNRIRGPVKVDSVESLLDRSALCRLAQVYALGIDTRDEAMVRSVFTPDAVLRGALGEAGVDEYVPKLLAGVVPFEATMHNITNQYASVDGDRGEVASYAVALHFAPAGSEVADLALGVRYEDRALRVDDGWLICAREVTRLWTRTG